MTKPMEGGPRQCTATSRQSGVRCKRAPVKGGTVCAMHGGKSPQVQAAIARRQRDAAAAEVVAGLWNPEAAPVTDAVSALQQLAGSTRHALDHLGRQLTEQDPCEECGRGEVDLESVSAAAWLRTLRELRQMLEAMERLNLGQKAVEVEAGRVRLVAAAVGRVFEVLELPAEQRVRGTEVLLAELRAGSSAAGQVVEP